MASTRSDDGLKVPPASPISQVSASRPEWSLVSGPTSPIRWPLLDPLPRLGPERLEVHLAVRALHEPGGAEPAAPQAAAGDLGEEEVAELRVGRVDRPGGRHAAQAGSRRAPRARARRRAACEARHPRAARRAGVRVLDVVERRDVGARPRGRGRAAARRAGAPARAARERLEEGRHERLALADQERVEEGRDRLRVDLHGDAARDDERVALVARRRRGAAGRRRRGARGGSGRSSSKEREKATTSKSRERAPRLDGARRRRRSSGRKARSQRAPGSAFRSR